MSSPSSASPPPVPVRLAADVGSGVEVQALGDRPRAHVHVEDVLELADGDAELLFSLAADRRLWIVLVEQPGRGLDQHPVRHAR